jgi:hypothetical protein
MAPDVIHERYSTSEYYSITNPKPGDCNIRLFGSDVPSKGEVVHVNVALIPANKPPIAICQDVTIVTGIDCLTDVSIDNGSFDPDRNPIYVTQTPQGPYSLGNNNVTLTITDGQGAYDTCRSTITVVDQTPPTITAPAQVTLSWC